MLGQTVYKYFSSLPTVKTWGTTRHTNNQNLLVFNIYDYEKNFQQIMSSIKRLDFAINCIGILKNYDSVENLISVNSLFPHQLENLAEQYSFKLFHVSTDMVFAPLSGIVTEGDTVSPFEMYGASKFLGETVKGKSLNFRTSILGMDAINHRGLLEWAMTADASDIKGFANQFWTGCTALQYALLCQKIIEKKTFESLRKKSNVYHFAPIKPVTKYQLIKDFINIIGSKKKVKKSKSQSITRILKTSFANDLMLYKFKDNHVDALKELIEFEKSKA